jgi:hypothetical protein
MPQPTKVQVLKSGVPLVGAEVVLGDLLGQAKETDEDGRIAFDLDAGYVAYVQALVTKAPDIRVTSWLELESEGEHLIEIP